MDDFARAVDGHAIRFERLLPGSLDLLWSYLEDSDTRGSWLARGTLPLNIGDTFEFHFHHAKLSPDTAPTPERFKPFDSGHAVQYRLIAREALRLLHYGWIANGCEALFRLSAAGERSKLVLIHSGLADRDETIAYAAGWHTHLAVLRDVLNGQSPPAFWPAYAEHEVAYRQRFAAVNRP